MLSSDFHCKENDGTTGAAHLIQTFLVKTQTPVVCQASYYPGIRRYHQKKSESSALLHLFCHYSYNENLTRTLNTTFTQMLLAINWHYWQAGKNSRICMKVQGYLMQVHFTEIHQVFGKKKRLDTFLTEGYFLK